MTTPCEWCGTSARCPDCTKAAALRGGAAAPPHPACPGCHGAGYVQSGEIIVGCPCRFPNVEVLPTHPAQGTIPDKDPTAPTPTLDVVSVPVGISEIAAMLGAKVSTVRVWRTRGVLPEPKWILSGTPAWESDAIEAWAKASGRWPADR